jgi:hypothetical protein
MRVVTGAVSANAQVAVLDELAPISATTPQPRELEPAGNILIPEPRYVEHGAAAGYSEGANSVGAGRC